eukprot:29392_3
MNRCLGCRPSSISGSTRKRSERWLDSGSFCFVTRYPGRPIFATLRVLGSVLVAPGWRPCCSNASLARRRAMFCWCRLPCVCARLPSFVMVRHNLHSVPKWLRMKGSLLRSTVSSASLRRRSRRIWFSCDSDAWRPDPVFPPLPIMSASENPMVYALQQGGVELLPSHLIKDCLLLLLPSTRCPLV